MRGFFWLVSFSAGLFMALTVGATPQDGLPYWVGNEYHGNFLDMDTYRAVILEFDPAGSLKVRKADGQELVVMLKDKVPIFARHKKDFNGRKRLAPTDLRVGQRIQVTYVKGSSLVLSLKVLRSKKRDRVRSPDALPRRAAPPTR